jgi:hypothetical protein
LLLLVGLATVKAVPYTLPPTTMAILKKFPGLTVKVLVDGIEAKEFHDPANAGAKDEDPNCNTQATCFVEAQLGSPFSVAAEWENLFSVNLTCPIRIRLHVDGVGMCRSSHSVEQVKQRSGKIFQHAFGKDEDGNVIKKELRFTQALTGKLI